MFLRNATNAGRNSPSPSSFHPPHTPLLTGCILSYRGIANLLNANEVGMKIFEDYANSWDWILM